MSKPIKVYAISVEERGVVKERWRECGEGFELEDEPGEYRLTLWDFPEEGRFQLRGCTVRPSRLKESITLKDVCLLADHGRGEENIGRVGIGFVNRDGSINVVLDAFPVNKTLLVKDRRPRFQVEGKERAA